MKICGTEPLSQTLCTWNLLRNFGVVPDYLLWSIKVERLFPLLFSLSLSLSLFFEVNRVLDSVLPVETNSCHHKLYSGTQQEWYFRSLPQNSSSNKSYDGLLRLFRFSPSCFCSVFKCHVLSFFSYLNVSGVLETLKVIMLCVWSFDSSSFYLWISMYRLVVSKGLNQDRGLRVGYGRRKYGREGKRRSVTGSLGNRERFQN